MSETEWLNQYHSMLLSNSPRTLLVEPVSTSVRHMSGLAPPRIFSLQNKKRFIIVSCHFVSECSFGGNLLVKKWVDIEFMFSLLTPVFLFYGRKRYFRWLSTSKSLNFCIVRFECFWERMKETNLSVSVKSQNPFETCYRNERKKHMRKRKIPWCFAQNCSRLWPCFPFAKESLL